MPYPAGRSGICWRTDHRHALWIGLCTPASPDATGLGRWSAADSGAPCTTDVRVTGGCSIVPVFHPSYTTSRARIRIPSRLLAQPCRQCHCKVHRMRALVQHPMGVGRMRALFFSPWYVCAAGAQSAEWNRGAYLVQGLGHCAACHTTQCPGRIAPTRSSMAAIPRRTGMRRHALGREAAVTAWPVEGCGGFVEDGRFAPGRCVGPMAEVVFRSLQYLSDADLRAMAVYLRSLPPGRAHWPPVAKPPPT